jgi:hypothetical protein
MNIKRIFRKLHDPRTWPPPPRPLLAALASDLRPAPEMIPLTADDLAAALKPWTPEQRGQYRVQWTGRTSGEEGLRSSAQNKRARRDGPLP